jgi:hypothetical protein
VFGDVLVMIGLALVWDLTSCAPRTGQSSKVPTARTCGDRGASPRFRATSTIRVVADTVDIEHPEIANASMSPTFGDIVANMTHAADTDGERLLALGAPIVVERGNGIEKLTSKVNR